MQQHDGAPIEPQDAWQMLDGWRTARQELGVIFWGRSANLYTLAKIESAANGRIELRADAARATFNLRDAAFRYGPMQTWPRWPSPPIVEVAALRAELPGGDYLALAEGLIPPPSRTVAPPGLPGESNIGDA